MQTDRNGRDANAALTPKWWSIPVDGTTVSSKSIAHRLCRLIWIILYRDVRYQDGRPVAQSG